MTRITTLSLVLVAGIAAALVTTSLQRSHREHAARLDDLASDSAALRAEAWRSIPATLADSTRASIRDRLASPEIDPEARLDAARAFHERNWAVPRDWAVAAGLAGDLPIFARWWHRAWPTESDALDCAAPVLGSLARAPSRAGDSLLEHLLNRSPEENGGEPDPVRIAGILEGPANDPPAPRITLALGRLGVVPRAGDLDPPDRPAALRALLADPGTTRPDILGAAPAWALAAAGDSTGEAALAWLSRAAEAGDRDAIRALGLRDASRVRKAETAILVDRDRPWDRRLLATLRLLGRGIRLDDALILNLLAGGPGDADDTVHGAALVAARGLSESASARLLDRWIHSENPVDRRAALVLAAVLQQNPARSAVVDEALDRVLVKANHLARDPEGDARVRRTARHVLRAVDRWPFPELDPADYAHRTTRLSDGRLDPDAVLLGMLASDATAARRLGETPRLPSPDARATHLARAIAWRFALLSSLDPDRLARIGEPVPGDEADLLLWVTRIAAEDLVAGPFADPGPTFAGSRPGGDTGTP